MYIYVVGNIQSFFSVLTGIQMLFNPSNNTLWASTAASGNTSGFAGSSALMLGTIIGLIVLILSGFMNMRIEFHKMLILIIIFIALWEVQTSVTVENLLTGNAVTVSGIPIGIAYPAGIFSTIAYDAAKEIGQAEQSATNPDPALFTGNYNSNYGFAGPLALTYKLRGLYSVFNGYDAPLSGSVAGYVDHCLMPRASMVDSGALIDSGNLGSRLFKLTPANNQVSINVNSSNQATMWTPVSCSTARTTLQSAWTAFTGGTGAASLSNVIRTKTQSGSRPGVGYTTASTVLSNMFTNTVNGGQDFIGNLILNCAVEAGGAQAANDMSNSATSMNPAISPYCTTKAAALGRQQAMNAGSASLFESNMIPMMALLQFLYFAMAPLVMIIAAMMGMGGLQMLGKYMIFGAWTESWIPVAQIINDYIGQVTTQLYTQIAAATAGQTVTIPGSGTVVNITATSSVNIPMILTRAMNELSMADMMMASTPIITLVLLTGSYFALTQLGSKISGNDVVDKNMGESTPTLGANTEAANATGIGMVNSGNVGGSAAVNAMGTTPTFSYSSAASSALAQTEQSNAAVTKTAVSSAAATGQSISTFLKQGEIAQSSKNEFTGGAAVAYSQMNSATSQLSSDFHVDHKDAATLGTAFSMGLGKNNAGKYTANTVDKLLGSLNIGADAKQSGDISNTMNSGVAESSINTLKSGVDATMKSGFETGVTTSDARKTAGSLAKSAAQTKAITSSVAASQAALESASQAAQEVQSAGGKTTIDMASLMSAIQTGAPAVGAVPQQFVESALDAVGTSTADQDQLLKHFTSSMNAGTKLAISGGPAALVAWAALNTANSMGNAAQASQFIARLTGDKPLMASTGALAQAVAKTKAAVGGSTNLASVPGQVSQVGSSLASDKSLTGTPDTAAQLGTELAAAQGAAQNAEGVNPNSEYDPGGAQEMYAADKVIADSALGTKQKLRLFAKNIPDAAAAKKIVNDVKQNDAEKISHWIQNHPGTTEAAAAAAVGLGLYTAGRALTGKIRPTTPAAPAAAPPDPNTMDVQGNPLPKSGGGGAAPRSGPSTSDRLAGRTAATDDAAVGADTFAAVEGGANPVADGLAIGLTLDAGAQVLEAHLPTPVPAKDSPVVKLGQDTPGSKPPPKD